MSRVRERANGKQLRLGRCRTASRRVWNEQCNTPDDCRPCWTGVGLFNVESGPVWYQTVIPALWALTGTMAGMLVQLTRRPLTSGVEQTLKRAGQQLVQGNGSFTSPIASRDRIALPLSHQGSPKYKLPTTFFRHLEAQ